MYSFPEIAGLIELGQDVTVTYSGQVVEGRALDITPTSLTVIAAGVPLELDEAAVTRVRQRWDDPMQNGAIQGFLWGAVPTTVLFLYFVKADGGHTADQIAEGLMATVGFAGGIGAAAGALVDRVRRERRDIYRRAPRRQLAVVPLVSRDRFGAAVGVAW